MENKDYKKFHYPVAFCKIHAFHVNWMVCDGAADNRALMEIWHCLEDAEVLRGSLPPHLQAVSTAGGHLSVRRHPVFLSEPVVMLSDVPHLTKKSRNNLEKSLSMFRNKNNGFIRAITVSAHQRTAAKA